MQETLDKFTDLSKVLLAGTSGAGDIRGYWLNDFEDTQNVTLAVTTTASSLLQLYRNSLGNQAANLPPFENLIIKPTFEVTVTFSNATKSIALTPGTFRLGGVDGSRGFARREIADTVFGKVPPLLNYYFISDTVSGIVNGFFVSYNQVRTGSAFSFLVETTSAINFEDLYGDVLPFDAVGALIDIAQDVKIDIDDGVEATVKTDLFDNKASHPTRIAGKGLGFGKIV